MKKRNTLVIVLSVVLVIMATFAALGGDQIRTVVQDPRITAQHTLSINPDQPQMTEEEVRNYFQTMSVEYGPDSIGALENYTENARAIRDIAFVGGWTDHLISGAGRSDSALLLFRIEKTGDSREDMYHYLLWSAARSDPGRMLNRLWIRNQMTDPGSRVILYSPGSATVAGSRPVRVGISFETPGVPMPESDGFPLHEGIIRPVAGECLVGSAGKFSVEWAGNSENIQVLYGGMVVVTARGSSPVSTWETSFTGG